MEEMNGESVARRPAAIVWGVLLAALVVRAGVLVARYDALSHDPDGYREVAANLLSHQTFGHRFPPGQTDEDRAARPGISPTAHRPPLYPVLLTPALLLGRWSTAGIAALHLALGLATVWLVWRLAVVWGVSRLGALASAGLVACDPILLNQSAEVMTETLATFLAVVLLAAWTWVWTTESSRSTAAWAGAIAGLAILCRPTFFPAAVIAAVILVGRWRGSGRHSGLFYLLAAAMVVSPWVVRNQLVFGRPILTTTHGGHTLRLANNAPYYAHVRANPFGTVWDSRELERITVSDDEARAAGLSREVLLDRKNYDLAEDTIERDPSGFGRATLDRLAKTWRLAPAEQPSESSLRRAMRWGVGLWYLAEYLLVAVGIYALGRRVVFPPWLFGVLLMVTFTLAHAVFWTDMRMRAPLVPIVCLLAAAGIERVLSRTKT